MADPADQVLLAEAVLGKDAEEFLKSDIGRYMVGRAEQEESEALDALAEVSFWRWRRVMQLQNRVWRARALKGWLEELVVIGRQAMQTLEAAEE